MAIDGIKDDKATKEEATEVVILDSSCYKEFHDTLS